MLDPIAGMAEKRQLHLAFVVPPFGLIWAYAGLDEQEQAFAYLERSFDERRDRMVWLNVDLTLDSLRSDPRLEVLVRRVGLPTLSSAQPR